MTCPYCGKEAEFVDSKTYYKNGKSYGMIYLCRPCDALVGAHKGSDLPLGTLANGYLRSMRIQTHKVIDPIWESKYMTRDAVYALLAKKMSLEQDKCHIGMFNVAQCQEAMEKMKIENWKAISAERWRP